MREWGKKGASAVYSITWPMPLREGCDPYKRVRSKRAGALH